MNGFDSEKVRLAVKPLDVSRVTGTDPLILLFIWEFLNQRQILSTRLCGQINSIHPRIQRLPRDQIPQFIQFNHWRIDVKRFNRRTQTSATI
jgi:hypothetical protein